MTFISLFSKLVVKEKRKGILFPQPLPSLFQPVLRIRFILIWIRILGSVSWNNGSGSGSCSKSDPKISTFVNFFFSIKIIILRNMICFVIYGVNIYVSKHKFNRNEKNVWYSYDFRWFSWKFSMILADFLLPGSESVSLKRIRIRLTKMKRIRIRNNDFNLSPLFATWYSSSLD